MPNEYISREDHKDTILHNTDGYDCDTVNYFLGLLYSEPAADVVEVVRCKDCEQYVAGELGYGKCNFFKTAIFSEFYCRYGGKKGRAE